MSMMMCDACGADVDTDYREVFEVRETAEVNPRVFCEACLMHRVETGMPFHTINDEPAAAWIAREVG